MAKKRTIDLENAEPLRNLPSSGVQVNYKHQTIIASDETSEYALLTRGKICEANIGVTYIRPAESDKFPFIIPINFDPSSPLSGTVAFTTDKRADAMTALREGRLICGQIVGEEHNLVPATYIICSKDSDPADTDPDHWNVVNHVQGILYATNTESAIINISVVDIDLVTNTWRGYARIFN